MERKRYAEHVNDTLLVLATLGRDELSPEWERSGVRHLGGWSGLLSIGTESMGTVSFLDALEGSRTISGIPSHLSRARTPCGLSLKRESAFIDGVEQTLQPELAVVSQNPVFRASDCR
jgi:hypothetical protein